MIFFGQFVEVLTVTGLGQSLGPFEQAFATDPAFLEGDLFKASHLQALTMFNGLNVLRCFEQAFVRAGVEPGEPPSKALYTQVSTLEVGVGDVGDFQRPAGRRLDLLGDLDDVVVVKIQTRDGIA